MSDNSSNKVTNPSSCHPPPFHMHHFVTHGLTTLSLYLLLSSHPLYQPQNVNLQLWYCHTGCLHLSTAQCLPFEKYMTWGHAAVQRHASIDEDNRCSLRQEPRGSSCNSNHQPHMMQWFVILLFHEGRKWSRCSCQEETAHPCTPARQAIIIGLCAINSTLQRHWCMDSVHPSWHCLKTKLPFCVSTFCGCSSTHPW